MKERSNGMAVVPDNKVHGGTKSLVKDNTRTEDLVVLAGNSHPLLSHAIAQFLGMETGACRVSKFSNGETHVEIMESVRFGGENYNILLLIYYTHSNLRGKDVFIVQTTAIQPNDSLIELLIMIDAVKRASAARITAVIPCLGFGQFH